MNENKFKYNPDTLQFEDKSKSKTKRLFISALSIFIGAIFISITIFIVYSYYSEAKNIKDSHSEFNILKEQYLKLLERKKQNDKYLNQLIEKDKKIYQAVFKSDPDNSIFEKENPYSKFRGIKTKKVINENTERLKYYDKITEKQKKDYKKILNIVTNYDTKELLYIPAIQPVFNKNLKYPVYGFGERIDQVYKSLVFHPGIDYSTPEGTAVFATANGTIEKAGNKRGLGNRIIINHGNGYKTTYAHLEDINVFKGEKIERGEKIGTVGMTGKSLIPHLHYAVNYKGKPINPVNYFFLDLNPEEYHTIRLQSAKSGLSLD